MIYIVASDSFYEGGPPTQYLQSAIPVVWAPSIEQALRFKSEVDVNRAVAHARLERRPDGLDPAIYIVGIKKI